MGVHLGPRYQCIRVLGSGGMGRVFLVHDAYLEKDLALKLLQDLDARDGAVEQMQKEFAILSELEHPGIARAHDFGYLAGRPYFTSEYVPGEALGARGPIEDVKAFLKLARDIADAVAFLHRSEILHLDIKPSNIIVSTASTGSRPMLIDFGVFRRGIGTLPGSRIQGSIPYMAPECFKGDPLGPWTDIYALGATLYRLATGSLPRGGASEGSRIFEPDWSQVPRPPSQLRPGFLKGFESILLKCLALDPSLRFRSGEDFLSALTQAGNFSRDGAQSELSSAQIVGREAELLQANQFLDGLVQPGNPRVLLVTGAPGMGQTHFLREVKVRSQTRGLRFCLETGYPGRHLTPGSLLRCLGPHMPAADSASRARWNAFLSRLKQPHRALHNETLDAERRIRQASEVKLAVSALRDPLILGVDGLQFWDEVSLQLLDELVRSLKEENRDEAFRIALVLGYREEGPFLPLLRELTDGLLKRGRQPIVALKPLDPKEALALYHAKQGKETEESMGLAVFQGTGGCPAKVIALTAFPSGGRAQGAEMRPKRTKLPQGVGKHGRSLLLALVFLERPAASLELSRITKLPRGRVSRLLGELKSMNLVVPAHLGKDVEGWLPGEAAAQVARAATVATHRSIHLRIAKEAFRSALGEEDPRRLEALRHLQAASATKMFLKHGIPAARYLKSTLQNRRALELYRDLYRALPRGRSAPRLELALEMADLEVRVGEFDQGIRRLQDLLLEARKGFGGEKARVLLRLAALHARKGEFRRADALFQEGFRAAGKSGRRLRKDEVLFFLNEHAAVKTLLGDYSAALGLCGEGLKLAEASRSPGVKEAAVNLQATKANVALRTLDYERARREFEAALELAEATGSLGSQAVILNNLGTVHGQCDRHPEAIRAFQEAERICLRIDEGPSLASIKGNLAVLYSKRGEFAEMREALQDAERLRPGSIGRRQEFFLEHARGLCHLYQGRFKQARAHLEAAIRLGEALGDAYVVRVDRVYRAEAMVFEAAYGEAAEELSRLSEANVPARVRKMALSRCALLSAFLGNAAGLELARARYAEVQEERPVPFLDAWDDLFFGWALSALGARDQALSFLERAGDYFERHELSPAAALSRWIKAECLLLGGGVDAASKVVLARKRPENELLAVLRPLLQARLLLERGVTGRELVSCADLLSEAGASLAVNFLPEWSLRMRELRAALDPRPKRAKDDVEKERREIARSLPEKARNGYLKSRYWTLWTRGFRMPALERTAQVQKHPPRQGDSTGPGMKTASLSVSSPLREKLVVNSIAMKRLASVLDKLQGSKAPVLIQGETGTGKEMIARILHEEGPRSAAPFCVVDCATIPAELLEAELFGARAGAFTSQEKDRQGILPGASGGTVFIDEVSGATLEAQAKLLRVLSERKMRPLGAEEEIPIDVRFVFSTSKDLDLEMKEGRLRPDFCHRIRVISVRIPPLRERPEDIPALVERLLAEESGSQPDLKAAQLGRGVLDRLCSLSWPGNVRELKNFVSRLCFEGRDAITLQQVDQALGDVKTATLFPRNLLVSQPLSDLRDHLERDYIVCHFRRLGGKTDALCKFLGLSSRQLYRKCVRLGIHLRQERVIMSGSPSRRDA